MRASRLNAHNPDPAAPPDLADVAPIPGMLGDVDVGSYTEPTKMTLNTWLARWLAGPQVPVPHNGLAVQLRATGPSVARTEAPKFQFQTLPEVDWTARRAVTRQLSMPPDHRTVRSLCMCSSIAHAMRSGAKGSALCA